ncbi:MAG: ATP-binding cassette domain-containing protein [Eubacterium sp.]|nr:ATP-binding cassette domain-containing protein [Eubacterium sp.]
MKVNLEGITKKYKRGTREQLVLNQIKMEIPEGKLFLIVGESGAGKSTLINIISGLCKADSGKITYNAQEITELSDTQRAVVRNRYTGIVTQNCDLIPYLSVIENMKLTYEIGNQEGREEQKKSMDLGVMERLGLLPLKNEFPKNLSGGEIKRAAIARALITEPPVIIMDEPTSNLDSKNRTKVLQLLKEYAQRGHTVIISSHEKEAIEYADTVFEISRL